jgi:alkylated DNA repair dioxygenase AlkB
MATNLKDFFTATQPVIQNKKRKLDDQVDHYTTKYLSDTSYIISGRIPKDICPNVEQLMKDKPEVPDTIIMMGKSILTPRFVAHYLRPYYYTGRTHDAKPLPDTLKPLLEWGNTEMLTKWKQEQKTMQSKHKNSADALKAVGDKVFNQALVNYYMNGNQYIGKHSDDERQLVKGSPIFSASLGQERTFRIRNKKDGSIVEDIIMKDGTFILMCGDMQKEFSHEVPKVMGQKGQNMASRINITFRIFQ